MSYYKKKKDIAIIFDTETKPNNDENLEKYSVQRMSQLVKSGSYKFNLAEDKESFSRSTSLVLSQIVAIGGRFLDLKTDKSTDFSFVDKNNEENVIRPFIEKIVNPFESDTVLWVHYNGLNFDCPIAIRKAIKYGIEIKNSEFTNLQKFRIGPHYDLCALLGNWGNETIDLETACAEFGILSPKDGKTNATNIKDSTEEEIVEYMMKDVAAEELLFKKLRVAYKYN